VNEAVEQEPATELTLTLYVTLILLAAAVAGAMTGEPTAFFSILLLGLGWRALREQGPPALRLVFIYQWVQVTIGIFYFGITGRYSPTMAFSDYRTMVYIGLAALASLFGGMAVAKSLAWKINPSARVLPVSKFSNRDLVVLYLVSLIATGVLLQTGRFFPGLYQAAFVLASLRFGFLYLAFRRLSSPRLETKVFVPLLAFEVLLGFTGFFADFREPIVFAAMALLQIYNVRKVRHTVALTLITVAVCVLAVTWTAIKPEYRSVYDEAGTTKTERITLLRELSTRFASNAESQMANSVDMTVDRLWAIYYPALAVERVPSLIPHTNGEFMWSGIRHILTPRLFFPEKPALASNSEKVRKYSGLYVAGEETGTSIAFGYVIELYIDFGIPAMFVPLFLLGMLLFWVFRSVGRIIRDPDISVAATSTITWFALYQFEGSWSRLLGNTLTLVIVIGGTGFALDRYLAYRRSRYGYAVSHLA
jgi:hypothetical protein